MMFLVGQPATLDQEFKNVYDGVEIIYKVVKSGDVYTYMYSVKNTGEKAIKFKSDVISRAMYSAVLVDIEPGKNVIFILEHPDPPISTGDKYTIFYLTNNEKIERIQNPNKKVKIKISSKKVYEQHVFQFGQAVLPKSFMEVK